MIGLGTNRNCNLKNLVVNSVPKRPQNPEDGANTQAFAILAPVVICTGDVKNVNRFCVELSNNRVDTNQPSTRLWIWILSSTELLHTVILHYKNTPERPRTPQITAEFPKSCIFFTGPHLTSFLHCPLPKHGSNSLSEPEYLILNTRIKIGNLTTQIVESNSNPINDYWATPKKTTEFT